MANSLDRTLTRLLSSQTPPQGACPDPQDLASLIEGLPRGQDNELWLHISRCPRCRQALLLVRGVGLHQALPAAPQRRRPSRRTLSIGAGALAAALALLLLLPQGPPLIDQLHSLALQGDLAGARRLVQARLAEDPARPDHLLAKARLEHMTYKVFSSPGPWATTIPGDHAFVTRGSVPSFKRGRLGPPQVSKLIHLYGRALAAGAVLESLLGLCEACVEGERNALALVHCQAGLAIAPHDGRFHNGLAIALARWGRTEASQSMLETARGLGVVEADRNLRALAEP